jgi:hypothetical protein
VNGRRLPLTVEDLAFAAWNAAGVPLVTASAAAPLLALGDAPNGLAGWVQLLAIGGAIVAIATRPAGAQRATHAGGLDARIGFIGPLAGAVAFVAGSASAYLGLDLEGPVVGTAFIAIVAAMTFGDRLPTIDAGLRRALLAPFIFVCAGIFDGFAADLLRDLDVAELIGALAVDETGFGLFIVGMLLAGLAAFYAALVVAPRVLVAPEAEGGCLVWPARFALFLVSAVFGIGWLTVLTT